jgi:hypothetical protein
MTSQRSRIERLEQERGVHEETCPDCGTPASDHFPIAFGGLPMCRTCRTLLLPPLGQDPMQSIRRASQVAPTDG